VDKNKKISVDKIPVCVFEFVFFLGQHVVKKKREASRRK
jgi:hypothetical protein